MHETESLILWCPLKSVAYKAKEDSIKFLEKSGKPGDKQAKLKRDSNWVVFVLKDTQSLSPLSFRSF